MILWLHEQGYTYFNIPQLTYPEINSLMNAKKRKMRKQETERKRASRKSKR